MSLQHMVKRKSGKQSAGGEKLMILTLNLIRPISEVLYVKSLIPIKMCAMTQIVTQIYRQHPGFGFLYISANQQ